MKNPILKLPLYLGLGVFILTVLMTGFKLGDNKSVASLLTRANVSGATLSMQSISSNTVSVLLTSTKEVSGLDVSIYIQPREVKALTSTLTPGPGYALSGGSYDENTQIFSFSALKKTGETSTDLVATFNLGGSVPLSGLTTDLSFVTESNKTVVLEKGTGTDVLVSTKPLSFKYRSL